jgi:hypothetical protein
MFEYIKWITVGIVAYVLMTAMGLAEEKKTSVIDDKIKSAQIWAIGFGADIKQQQIQNLKLTREALKQDWSWSEGGRFTWRLKNEWEDIKHYQRIKAKEGREQREKTGAQIRGYWQTIADALGAGAGATK